MWNMQSILVKSLVKKGGFLCKGSPEEMYRKHTGCFRYSDFASQTCTARNTITPTINQIDRTYHPGEESILVLNWGSTAVSQPTLDTRLIFTLVKLSERVKTPEDPTLQMVYKVFRWSLKALSEGVFPWEDHNGVAFSEDYYPERFEKRGTPLADDYVGAFSEIRGDWKWIRECFYLEQHYGANYICHLCRAHKHIERLKFTDVSRNAYHRRTLVDSLKWWTAYTSGVVVSWLAYIPGFNVWRIVFDLMHTLDLGYIG
jgi:hypothetical protein